MRLVLLGPGSGSFLAALEEAKIPYERQREEVPLGVPMNAVGDLINIVEDAIPWASIAAVIVAWLRAQASRKVIVTTKDKQVLHTEGLSVKQVGKLLKLSEEVSVVDIQKPEAEATRQLPDNAGPTIPLQERNAEPENGEDG